MEEAGAYAAELTAAELEKDLPPAPPGGDDFFDYEEEADEQGKVGRNRSATDDDLHPSRSIYRETAHLHGEEEDDPAHQGNTILHGNRRR